MRAIKLSIPVTKISDTTMTRVNQSVRSVLSSIVNTTATSIRKSLPENIAHPLAGSKSSPPSINPLRATLSRALNSIKNHSTAITNKSKDPEQKEIKQFTKALNSHRSKSDRVAANLIKQNDFKLPTSLGGRSITTHPSKYMAKDIAISAAFTQKPETFRAAMDKFEPLDEHISFKIANKITDNFENLVRGSDKKSIRKDGEILKILVENQRSAVAPIQITRPLQAILDKQIHAGNPFMADVSADLQKVISEINSAPTPKPLQNPEKPVDSASKISAISPASILDPD